MSEKKLDMLPDMEFILGWIVKDIERYLIPEPFPPRNSREVIFGRFR